jgi:hypothetical protein
MKKFLLPVFLLLCGFCQGQKKYHATVIDADNNVVARGLFQTVGDSSIVITVDNLPVTIFYNDINILKIEKNESSLEFAKLGSSMATEVVNKVTTPGTDSVAQKQIISQQSKTALLDKAGSLLQSLLDGLDDVATFTISRSLEKFTSKIKLMQEYSLDEEVVKTEPQKPAVGIIQVKPVKPVKPIKDFNGTVKATQVSTPANNTVIVPTRPGRNAVVVPTKPGKKETTPAKQLSL